jgi:hypothetical protein
MCRFHQGTPYDASGAGDSDPPPSELFRLDHRDHGLGNEIVALGIDREIGPLRGDLIGSFRGMPVDGVRNGGARLKPPAGDDAVAAVPIDENPAFAGSCSSRSTPSIPH